MYLYENDLLTCESHINGFSNELFSEYDDISEEKNLKSKIEDLMNSRVVNHSENQAATHPQYRKKSANRGEVLQTSLGRLNSKLIEKNLRQANVIILAIGGSYEGPKLLLESIKQHNFSCLDTNINYQFITGPDSDEFISKTELLNPKNTIFIVASKSFTTDETIESLKKALEWSIDATHFIAITSNINEPLKYGIKKIDIINFDSKVGGRYSIWSPIGEFICDYYSFGDFLDGGKKADEDLQKFSANKYLDFVKYLAFTDIWHNNSKGKNTRAVLSYIWKIRSFPNYVQQLEMESLGKHASSNSKFKNTGQIIFGGYGPTAQHSYFQLLHQGTQEICADIIASKEDLKGLAYAQAITQSKLLSNGAENFKDKEKINGNVPTNLFLLKKVDPFSIGYLIATWEHRVFVTAIMLGINPFDQFGVNAGKIYTKNYIKDNGG